MQPDGSVETPAGVFSLACRHDHHAGDKVSLLLRPGGVRQAAGQAGAQAAGWLAGRVADVVFYQDRFKVVLADHLYFYLPEAPIIGEEIALQVSAEALQCLS